VIIATFVYNTAQRDEKMPRNEMPAVPTPQQRAFWIMNKEQGIMN